VQLIRDNIGRAGHDKFARSRHTSWPTYVWIFRDHRLDGVDDPQSDLSRRNGVAVLDKGLEREDR
jgi:hypothetical protein